MESFGSSEEKKIPVCHLTTVHPASDNRIYHREISSLVESGKYRIVYAAHGELGKRENVEIIHLGNLPKSRLARILRSQLIAIWILITKNFRNWHIHDPELLPFAIFLTYIGKKVVWDAHEDYELQFDRNIFYRKYLSRFSHEIFGFMIKKCLKYIDMCAHGVIAATPAILNRYQNKNSIVVGNEARIEEFELATPSFKNNTAFFSGSLDSYSCFELIIHALKKFPQIKLVVATNNSNTSAIKLGKDFLGDRFVFEGHVDRKRYTELISKSTFGFVTYANLATNEENEPNKRYEFAAAGLPVLATPNKSNKEWVKRSNAGIVAEDFSISKIELAISHMISDETAWSDYSINGRRWAKIEGNWQLSEKRMLNLYEVVFN